MKQKRYQEGYWISIGSGFGIMFGLLIGTFIGNSSIGLLIGAVIGIVFGYFLENKFNPNPIPCTTKQWVWKIVMALVAFIIAFGIVVFLLAR